MTIDRLFFRYFMTNSGRSKIKVFPKTPKHVNSTAKIVELSTVLGALVANNEFFGKNNYLSHLANAQKSLTTGNCTVILYFLQTFAQCAVACKLYYVNHSTVNKIIAE